MVYRLKVRPSIGGDTVAAVALLLAVLILQASAASAQVGLLQGLSHQRTLFGSPLLLGEEETQVRVTLDGAFRTADFDGEARRQGRQAELHRVLLNTDFVFAQSAGMELGARLGGGYWRSDSETEYGLDFAGVIAKFRLSDGTSGLRSALGVAVGQSFRTPGAVTIEGGGFLGLDLGDSVDLDGQVDVFGMFPEEQDAFGGGGVRLGPLWTPVDLLSVAIDVSGELGQWAESTDLLTWSVEAALRAGFDLGGGHELALSGRRTVIGARVEEETTAVLTWRFCWTTEGGLLRLDDDGGPSPEPAEGEAPLEGI